MRDISSDAPFTPEAVFSAAVAQQTVICGPRLEKDSRMVPVGYILFTVGLVFCIYWQIRFLAVAYNRSAWWLFGCLFVPFVDWIFLFLNFKATRKAFGLNLVGMIVAGLGGWMAGVVLPN
jgi:hypothetical protein